MAEAHGLVVGLREVDPAAYNGWNGRAGCAGCELDVDNIGRMLWGQRIKTYPLKTSLATSGNVKFLLNEYAKNLKSGDLLVFYYSGHGSSTADQNGDESDGRDETLVLYNRHLIDDELNEIWLKFAAGVRIVMISDSCESGTNFRLAPDGRAFSLAADGQDIESSPIVPMDRATSDQMRASLIHMGGCRDAGVSSGWAQGGEFTIQLLDVWSRSGSSLSYRELFNRAAAQVRTRQVPQFNEYGPGAADLARSPAFDSGNRGAADDDDMVPGAQQDDQACTDADESRVRIKLDITGADLAKLSPKLKSEAGSLMIEALKSAKTQYGKGKISVSDKFGPGTHATVSVVVTPGD